MRTNSLPLMNPKESTASQYQIARLTGVSPTTVSRARANHPRISEATKAAVNAAAKKLGYRPDPQISLLKAQIRRSRVTPSGSTNS